MLLMIWKMCTWPLWYNIILFFWALLYKGWNISLSHKKEQSLQWLGVLYFSPWWYLLTLCSSSFCFWILAYVRLGVSNFILVSLTLLVPAWLSAFCPWHPFCSILPAVVCIFYLSHLYSRCWSFMHIFHTLYFFCHVVSYRPNLICNIFVV